MLQVYFRQYITLLTMVFEKRRAYVYNLGEAASVLPYEAQHPVWLWLVGWAQITEDTYAPQRWLLAASIGT